MAFSNWYDENRLNLKFSSQLEYIDKTIDIAMEFIDSNKLEIDKFDINVVLRELITNAIIHGNGQDPEKQVIFSIYHEKGILKIELKDEGNGFSPTHQIETKSDVLQPHGMGLTIIKELGFKMSYDNKTGYQYLERRL